MSRPAAFGIVLTRPYCLAMLAGFVLLVLIGLTNLPLPPEQIHPGSTSSDAVLWQNVIDRMRAGGGYYDSMELALRTLGYRLKPFVNFRPPALASFAALFPTNTGPQIFLTALSLAVFVAWTLRMRSWGTLLAAVALLTFPIVYCLTPQGVVYHDTWVGLLIALALAVHPRHWRISLVCGVLALAIREHAVVFAGVMFLCSWRNRRECIAWAVAIVGFAVYLGIHAWLVSGHVRPDDLAKSWTAFGGWSFVVSTAQCTWLTIFLPPWVSAIVLPLALLGLAALDDYRPLAVVGGYIGAFLLVGNPDNWYWGLLYAPLLAVGIAAGIPALWAMLRDIVRRSPITSSRTEPVP